MGKYNLGKNTHVLFNRLTKENLYINERKVKKYVNDMEIQLDILNKSFSKVQMLINQSVNMKYVSGKRAIAFKNWAKKAKSQSNQAEKIKMNLNESIHNDLNSYPLQMLDERIAELEKKIADMTNN